MDNRLAHMDQASFLGVRAMGYGALVQYTWIYDRPVDMDGLRRFHRNLGHGLLSRRIERSPLPFARDRWVAWPGPADIDVADRPRPRSEVAAWTYERACLPIDPEYGPSWHLGVLPLEDGGTAVTVVASHTVADGLGLLEAIAEAAAGRLRELSYPEPGSRTRGRAIRDDGRLTLKSIPELARGLRAAARIARKQRKEVAASFNAAPSSPRFAGDDQPVAVPMVTLLVDTPDWDACAHRIGGNSFTLFAAFAARLGVRMGRVAHDGTVTLSVPMSDRDKDDTRGNALVFTTVSVDPTKLASDLGEVRLKFKQALADLAADTEELLAPLALTSLTPKWVARKAAGVGLGTAAAPVGCSNMGENDPAINRADGSDAAFSGGRLIEPGISRRILDGMGGQLFVATGRNRAHVWISINAYLPGRENSQEALRHDVFDTLAEFGLTANTLG